MVPNYQPIYLVRQYSLAFKIKCAAACVMVFSRGSGDYASGRIIAANRTALYLTLARSTF